MRRRGSLAIKRMLEVHAAELGCEPLDDLEELVNQPPDAQQYVSTRRGKPWAGRDRAAQAARARHAGMTWAQVGALIGVSRERARQVVRQAWRRVPELIPEHRHARSAQEWTDACREAGFTDLPGFRPDEQHRLWLWATRQTVRSPNVVWKRRT